MKTNDIVKPAVINKNALNAFIEFFKYWDFNDFYRHSVYLRWPDGNDLIKLKKRKDEFRSKGINIFWEEDIKERHYPRRISPPSFSISDNTVIKESKMDWYN